MNTSDIQSHGLMEIAGIAAAGAVVGVGRLLASADPITWRYAIGRAVLSAALATSCFTVLAWIPNAPTALVVGVAMLLASLGSSGLTMLAQRVFNTTVTIEAPTNDQPSKD